MLGADYLGDGYQYKIGSLSGQSGSIVDGKDYTFFTSHESMCSMVDEMNAGDGTLLFNCNNGKGRGVSYADPQKKYRIIYTSFVFSGIRGVDEKNELMKIYLGYLLPPTPVFEEYNNPDVINTGTFTIVPLILDNQLEFTLHNAARIQVDLSTISGRFIQNFVNRDFSEGTYRIDLNLNDKAGSGMYLLRFNADGKVINKKMVFTK